LPFSQESITDTYPFVTFLKRLFFYGEYLLAPVPNPSWRITLCQLSVIG